MEAILNRKILEKLYAHYNKRSYVYPDPIEFLYQYDDPSEREIAGLIASSLAYGNVRQIIKSVANVLQRITPTPCRFLMDASREKLRKTFSDFRHRFTTGDELSFMLYGAKHIIKKHGSLCQYFKAHLSADHDTIIAALSALVCKLNQKSTLSQNSLIPLPSRGSACKRLNLYLRWMVRCDNVDPGGWSGVPTSKLIVPLDTHMYRIGIMFGFTKRRQADLKTAIEITKAFQTINPTDPVKYDFALTRFGIRNDLSLQSLTCFIAKNTNNSSRNFSTI